MKLLTWVAATIAIVLGLSGPSVAIAQQAGTQAAGLVESVTEDLVTLTNGSTFPITGQTRVTLLTPATAGDLQMGWFLSITARRAEDGLLDASIIRKFPDGATAAPSQRPMDETNIMTNANIDDARVDTLGDGLLSVSFGSGTDQVRITSATQIEVQSVGSLADLATGAAVTAFINPEGVVTNVWVHVQ